MNRRGDVLVAIINNQHDFAIAREQHWYRIPVQSMQKWLRSGWPPRWLALYQTKVFGSREGHAITYYAQVLEIRQVARWKLFPDEPHNAKSYRQYYQLLLTPLQLLPQPILSRRLRRIVFITTTWYKFMNAIEINDLFDDSPLEDRLWGAFKRWAICAERQEFIQVSNTDYALDFAIYCAKGKIDIEADGDSWHANSAKAVEDNRRDNALKTAGWKVLRFTTQQVNEELVEYCIPIIITNINSLGGIDEGGVIARRIDMNAPQGMHQLGIFDGQ